MCCPWLALALKTDELDVTQTLHPIGQICEYLYATAGRSGRKELDSALADALLLQIRVLEGWSLGAKWIFERLSNDVVITSDACGNRNTIRGLNNLENS